jgi:hypothetical protein
MLNLENPDPDGRAVVYMGLSLIAIWCLFGGTIMHLNRNRFVHLSRSLKIGWKVRFVILSIGMALVEEALTTSLTNLAPYFGGLSDAARITASTNYFRVLSNSLLAFIPWFICWAWFLGLFDFKPLEVVLLFGLTGLFAESTMDSVLNLEDLAGVGMWVFVYGLMVYLPALTIPQERDAQTPRWYHLPLVIFLPLIFVIPLGIWIIYQSIRRLVTHPGQRRSNDQSVA